MKLRKNQLIGLLSQDRIAMEEDVQDGKLFRERERVIYARLSDFAQLGNATSADYQFQWQIKLPKTEKNQAKGTLRVRKVIPMVKSTEGDKYEVNENTDAQYVMTAKAERQADDRLEVPVPVTKDMFDLFNLLAENGMEKHRYHFPVDNGLVFEVDVYLKEDGSYHEWVKIDLELKDISVDIPELPIKVEEQILDKTEDEAEKKKISELYETIFLRKAETSKEELGTVAQEGIFDWLKEKFPSAFTETEIAKVERTISLINTATQSTSDTKENFKFSEDTIQFLFRGGNLVNNIPREIRKDSLNFALITGFFTKFNNALDKVKEDSEQSESNQFFSNINKADLTSIDGLDILGNIAIKFNSSGAGRAKEKDKEDIPNNPNPLWYFLWLLFPIAGWIIGIVHYTNNKLNYKKEIKKFERSGSFVRKDFAQASSELVKEIDNLKDQLVKYQKHAKRLESSKDKEIKDILKFGNNLAHSCVFAITHYDKFYKAI